MENIITEYDFRNVLNPYNVLRKVIHLKDAQSRTPSRSLTYFRSARRRQNRTRNEISNHPLRQCKQGDVKKKANGAKISQIRETNSLNVSPIRRTSHERLLSQTSPTVGKRKKSLNTSDPFYKTEKKRILEDIIFRSLLQWLLTVHSKKTAMNRQLHAYVYNAISEYIRIDTSKPTVKLHKNELLLDITEQISATIEDILADCDYRELGMDAEFDSDLFSLLIIKMKTKGYAKLVTCGHVNYTYLDAADILEMAKSFDDKECDSPDFSNQLFRQILTELTELIWRYTYSSSVKDMGEIIQKCSKYLARKILEEADKDFNSCSGIHLDTRATASVSTITESDKEVLTLINDDSCSTADSEFVINARTDMPSGIEVVSNEHNLNEEGAGQCNRAIGSMIVYREFESTNEHDAKIPSVYGDVSEDFVGTPPINSEGGLNKTSSTDSAEYKSVREGVAGNTVPVDFEKVPQTWTSSTNKLRTESDGSQTCSSRDIFSTIFEDNLMESIASLSQSASSEEQDRLNHVRDILMIDLPNTTDNLSDEIHRIESYEDFVTTYSDEFSNLAPLPCNMENANKDILFDNLRYFLKPIHQGGDGIQLPEEKKSCTENADDELLPEKCNDQLKYDVLSPVCSTKNIPSPLSVPKSKIKMEGMLPGFMKNLAVPCETRKILRSLFPTSSEIVCTPYDSPKNVRAYTDMLLCSKFKASNLNHRQRANLKRIYSVYTLHSVISDTTNSPVLISQPACLKTIQYFMTKTSNSIEEAKCKLPAKISETKALMKNFSTSTLTSQQCTRTPILPSPCEVLDWQATIKNFVWNVQAWRDWINEHINIGINYHPIGSEDSAMHSWLKFQCQVVSQVVQWQRYDKFCDAFTSKVNGNIVKVNSIDADIPLYNEWLHDLLSIKAACKHWTQWFLKIVNETEPPRKPDYKDEAFGELCWQHFKGMSIKYIDEWERYNKHWKISYEEKYKTILSIWLPSWSRESPVWISSSFGMVPSGAVGAGTFEGEVIWLARVMHQSRVVPAALHPSKQCACVYAEDKVHYYSKYQVLCNAKVSWMTWRDNFEVNPVLVAAGVRVGRVQHCDSHFISAIHTSDNSCHVNLYGRPLAFQYYEILVIPPL